MKPQDFEDYLMDKFHETDGATCLDNQLPDAFNEWVQSVAVDDLIAYAEKWHKEEVKKLGEMNKFLQKLAEMIRKA